MRGGSLVLSMRLRILLSKTNWLASGIILAVLSIGAGGPANNALYWSQKCTPLLLIDQMVVIKLNSVNNYFLLVRYWQARKCICVLVLSALMVLYL